MDQQCQIVIAFTGHAARRSLALALHFGENLPRLRDM